MAKVVRANAEYESTWYGVTYVHYCPGCKHKHRINVEKPNHCGAIWSFNGDMESPTFSPSINIVGQCHYFIRNGMIEYCSDSKHELAGQIVPLPDIEDR